MDPASWVLLTSVIILSFANGANDNFKGVATLFGSGTTGYRVALSWATAMTFPGSLTAVVLADSDESGAGADCKSAHRTDRDRSQPFRDAGLDHPRQLRFVVWNRCCDRTGALENDRDNPVGVVPDIAVWDSAGRRRLAGGSLCLTGW